MCGEHVGPLFDRILDARFIPACAGNANASNDGWFSLNGSSPRVRGTRHLLGLDYAGAQAAAEGIGLSWPAVAAQVMAMEAAVLQVQSQSSSARSTR